MQQPKALYPRQMFFTIWFEIFVNPLHFAHASLCAAIAELEPMLTGRRLDSGSGAKPCRELLSVDVHTGLAFDSEAPRQRGGPDRVYDGKIFPRSDASFNAVVFNRAMEHVFDPDEFVANIADIFLDHVVLAEKVS
jgi:hypothetical protein